MPYPAQSSVTHTYEADDRPGYLVQAAVRLHVTYEAFVGGGWVGPYSMGDVTLPSSPLEYPVEQAQPELVALG